MKHRRISTHGGVEIAFDDSGLEDWPAVVFLHGGGQTRHSWREATVALNRIGYRTLNVDLRGHGDSSWAGDGDYRLDAHVGDITALIAELTDRPAMVGASLGGMIALVMGGEHDPPAIGAVVLVDVVPRFEPQGTAAIQAFMRGNPEGFASLDEAAQTIAEYLPHRPRPPSQAGLRKNLREGVDGRFRWHWDPAMMAGPNEIGAAQARLDEAARRLKVPTLLIRGELSRVVSDEGVRAFRAKVPHARYAQVAGADHMVAGDRNSEFVAPLIDFLQVQDEARPRAHHPLPAGAGENGS